MSKNQGLLAVVGLSLIIGLGLLWQQQAGRFDQGLIAPAVIEPAAGPVSASKPTGSVCVTREQICRVAVAPQSFPCSCYDPFHGNVPGRIRLLTADPGPIGSASRIMVDEGSLFEDQSFNFED